ncbi:MAG TPA: ABC transporter permease [Geminicoccaceae bacterium]|nr:ABC transporter permease [Geminicoccaceae bacterium]
MGGRSAGALRGVAAGPAGERLRQAMPLLTLVALVVIVGAVTPQFLTPRTLIVLAADTATLFVLATGVTFVIMLGGIDLSIQAVASLASVIVALTLSQLGYLGFPLAVLAGAAAGLASGLVHVKLKIPSFIATLAVGGVVAGTALIVSDARSITMGDTERGYLGWISGTSLGIPHEVLIGAAVLLVAHVVQSRTPFGRYGAAIGAGEAAAFASGVKVDRHKILACVLSGGFAAFAGVILAGRLASGSPTLANELLLPAIAAVIVGGTAITGGVGSIWRTLIGALIISVVRIGMTFVGVDIFAQQIVFGAVLILAAAVTIDRSKIPIVK